MNQTRAIPGTAATRTRLRPGGYPPPRSAGERVRRVQWTEPTRPWGLEGSADVEAAPRVGGFAGQPRRLARRAAAELEVRGLQPAKRLVPPLPVGMAGEPRPEVLDDALRRVPGTRIEPSIELGEFPPQSDETGRRLVRRSRRSGDRPRRLSRGVVGHRGLLRVARRARA